MGEGPLKLPLVLLTRFREAARISRPSVDTRNFKLVVIVAGEASADLHGSHLVTAIKSMDTHTVFWGIGGKRMQQAGVRILIPSSDMAVVGLTEAFFHLRTIVKARGKLKSVLKNNHPDLLILIDYPDFNIHIAGIAKRFHVPVLYYISPQVWAWRRGRVRKISRRIDRMAVILPFEQEFYRRHGLNVDFVGHPLLDAHPAKIDKKKVREKLGLDQGFPVVGLLPGSRKEEIKNLLPVMIDAAKILGGRYHGIRFFLQLAPTIKREFVQSFIKDTSVEIKIFQGDIYEVLSICDIALVASGTATLETAIIEVPMIIAYKVSPISHWTARRVVKVPHIGLVNLVAGEKVVPELIQDEVTPERLAHEALTILENDHVRENMVKKLRGVKKSLGKRGASKTTAKIAFEMMR
jgi:lipid-A-disaccharide synthase